MRSTLSRLGCAILAIAVVRPAWAQAQKSIPTDNVVPLQQVVSPNGFVHPGIPLTKADLTTLRATSIASRGRPATPP